MVAGAVYRASYALDWWIVCSSPNGIRGCPLVISDFTRRTPPPQESLVEPP